MKQIYCKYCGLELEKDSCSCEASLDAVKLEKIYVQKTKCDTCGKVIDIDSNYCPYCGIAIEVDGKNKALQKELRGEFAEDVLEKYNIKKKRVKKDNVLLISKILTVILSIVLIALLYIKFFSIKTIDDEKETYLQTNETNAIKETQETKEIQEPETQPYITIKDKWIKQDGYYYCFDNEGEPVVDDWVTVENDNGDVKYYYFDTDGRLVINSWIDGEYYVGSDGAMYIDRDTPDGARVDENGKIIIEEDENVTKIPVERETYVYYEAPNSSETIVPSSQKSGSSGVIKGVDPEKTYELYIKSLIQVRDIVYKNDDKCNIIFYCPVIVGAKEKEVNAINEELINIFNERMKTILRGKAEKFSEIPKSIVLNIYEQKNISKDRFFFLASGKIVPRSGLSEKIKFRFTYDRKSKKITILEINE